MTRAKAYGQLRSEVSRLVNKTRPLPVGAELRRLIDRLGTEALRIDAEVTDREPVGADWLRQRGLTRNGSGRAS